MDVANLVAQWALPSWQEGCVLVDQSKRVLSLGYTGFPRHLEPEEVAGQMEIAPDDADLHKDQLGRLLVRAHENAVLFAATSLQGASAYLSYPIDLTSASILIQSGVRNIVCPAGRRREEGSCADDPANAILISEASNLLKEAGVTLSVVPTQVAFFGPLVMRYLELAHRSHGRDRWDNRYLALSLMIAGWSKDPSTQVGCVIADERNRFVSCGFNGFAMGVNDCQHLYSDRRTKYPRVIHAEKNAILHAQRHRVAGATVYVTMQPCASCAAFLANADVDRVVALDASQETRARWQEELALSSWVLGRRFRELAALADS